MPKVTRIVFSGSRLPAPPPSEVYQLWLLTAADPVSVGLFTPDEAGRFTIVSEHPPQVTMPVAGASVTVEPAGGSELPSGPTLLARAQPQQP